MIALFFVFIIVGWARSNPALAPKGEVPLERARQSMPAVIWPIVIFLVVIGGLLKGFFTPTEAGSVGTSAVLFLCLAQRSLLWENFIKAVDESLRTACMVIMLIAGSASSATSSQLRTYPRSPQTGSPACRSTVTS